ncbi:MAG: copper resistance protein CopC [Reyranella sp.]|nr:copper resistance protein CopC [Reyranella sp.]
MGVGRRVVLAGGGALMAFAPAARAQATREGVRMMESAPRAHAIVGGASSAYFVRFDRPVDHVDSRLSIRRGGQLVQVLHPRLESAPEVLFARAPTLPPGDYTLHWRVITPANEAIEGEIPFTVAATR